MPKWTDVLVSLCLSLLVFGGLYFCYLGLRNIWLAVASKGWPAASGVVRESRVDQRGSRDSESGTVTQIHSAKLRVEYSVGGRHYETGTVFFGQTEGSADSSEAELLRMRYPEGLAVKVYHHPDTPEVAALKQGLFADALWLPGAGIVFTLAGVMFLLMYYSAESGMGGMGWGLAFFGTLFLVIGLAMTAAGGHNIYLGYVSRGWPATQGEIVYSMGEKSESVTEDEEGERRRSMTYSTRLVYRYAVDGFERYGNVRQFGELSGAGREWAEQIVEKYPKGAKVRVVYDPSDPDTSVLEPGVYPDAYWIPGIGLAVLSFWLAVILLMLPSIAKDPMEF